MAESSWVVNSVKSWMTGDNKSISKAWLIEKAALPTLVELKVVIVVSNFFV